MENGGGRYRASVDDLQRELLTFLGAFEAIQENLKLGEVKESQAQLMEAAGDTFRRFQRTFISAAPPKDQKELHEQVCAAVTELDRAYSFFLSPPNQQWSLAFLHSRRAFCRGLYALYDLRHQLPLLESHFLLPGASAPVPAGKAASDGAGTGFLQREKTAEHSQYTLYVPEDYTPARSWPLIVCLHGGYGEGFEYIWTWLRPARSHGYILLSPKSLGPTWDMTMQSADTRSVVAMLAEVARQYSIDRSRVYLTGLSDGGIFTYILGIERHDLFAGLAVVAGALHMAVDPMLREGRARDVPLFVVHGVHDFIFPVAFTRQTCELMKGLGYNIRYEELPEWGHAFPYSINQTLVLPWFEALPPKQLPD
jgi:phospholipase/carboxylesterase